ncbi:hypothetical protein ONS95_000473 [Cadophora gregata]|uniref:uncharacterized protein n=1 Tax=Cadophora gregata TaxID=51156 RepID=UPI0026DB3C3D|nr:uncharacterized protein ONS95_000473 [Cadophora gregata]KAK0128501.1 hypothetical protein ONS95_000473 [Cadophora gregata]
MKLVKIRSDDVDSDPEAYNSNFHTELEAPGLPITSETPQSFLRWLPLIIRSQAIPPASIQHMTLTPPQTQLILDASQASLHTRELNRLYAEELATFKSAFETLSFPPEGFFLRLDECSPKDGVKGTAPLKSAEQIILRLTTSHRATNAMIRQKEKNGGFVELVFLPYNAKMDTAKEFRVFCAPPDGRITVVSQYKWHKASFLSSKVPGEIDGVVGVIMEESLRIHAEIMADVEKGGGGEMDKLLLEQGFTFDVLFDEESRSCPLIELNSFGARSGCGSCLFHWLRDRDVLYGKQHEQVGGSEGGTGYVEFRISI